MVLLAALVFATTPPAPAALPNRILIMSRTLGYRHDSIPTGVAEVTALAKAHGIEVEATEDSTQFTHENLKRFGAVVFLSTTSDILDEAQQLALRRFVGMGGGYMGIHAAADTEYDWPWYRELVGAWFLSHPAIQQAKIDVVDHDHPATKHLPQVWTRTDEWYDFRALPPADARILLKLDNSSYQGSKMGDNHPTAWCREVDGGRSFYTGGGHTKESFAEPDFQKHLEGGLLWVLHKA